MVTEQAKCQGPHFSPQDPSQACTCTHHGCSQAEPRSPVGVLGDTGAVLCRVAGNLLSERKTIHFNKTGHRRNRKASLIFLDCCLLVLLFRVCLFQARAGRSRAAESPAVT